MRQFSAILAVIIALAISCTAWAADEVPAAIDAPIDAAVYEKLVLLTEASFREKVGIVEEMADSSGQQAVLALQILLNSQLYHDEEGNQEFYQLVQDSAGKDQLYNLKTGRLAPDLSVKQLDKVRTNNRLRKAIKQSIAKIRLFKGSEPERLAALQSMLGDMDADNAKLVTTAMSTEASESIQELMQVAMAIYRAGAGAEEEKFAAIKTLQGRLEPEVRAALTGLVESSKGNKVLHAAALKALQTTEEKVEFYGFVEKLFFGLSLGSVLLLAAIGLAITFGVMGVINMAHGEMIMLGAYTTYVIQLLMPNHIGYSIIVAIPAAFVVSGLVGIAIQQGIIRFLEGRPLETLLATFGLSLILQQAVRSIFSPLNRQVSSPEWMSGALEINPVLALTFNRLYILAFSLLVFAVLMYVFKKTNLGLNVRAVSQNRDMARAMGVKTQRVDALTFGLGSGVAGVAGVALSQLTNVGPNLGQSYIIDSFMVVVFGGVGNLLGTLVGSFSLGIANKFLEPLTGAVLAKILVLVFIILFIQKRPKGLFPQKGRAAE